MDTERLSEILRACFHALEENQVPPPGVELVDCHMQIPIDIEQANEHREELLAILSEWPHEAWGAEVPRLEEGPSYIHAGGVVGSQQLAFVLFAVGKVLGLWELVTPSTLGFEGGEADAMARRGLVMISGYNPDAITAS